MSERPVSTLPPGTHFARIAFALALAKGDPLHAASFAESKWGSQAVVSLALKQAVAAGSISSMLAIADYRFAASELIAAARAATILGSLPGVRRVPMHVKVPRATAGAAIGWVGEGSPRPLSNLALDMVTLDRFALSGLLLTTAELVKLAEPVAIELIRTDLIAAVAEMTDQSFIDPTRAGEAGVSPAAINYGATNFAAAGTNAAALRSDLAALFDSISGDLAAPVLITNRRQAIRLALMDTPLTQNVKANGGVLAGCPLIVSASSPEVSDSGSPASYTSTLTLVDAAEILLADEGAAYVDSSEQALLQTDTAPDSPATASTVMVSLYQNGLTAWRVTREINWKMRQSGKVAYITGAAYVG